MMRYSKQRDAILRILQSTDTHPTAEWIFHRARKEIPSISLGTVYRNLNQLADRGLVLRLFDHGFVHYDGQTARHDHLRCLECGRIYDLQLNLDGVADGIPEKYNFQVTGYTLEVTGTCAQCLLNHDGESNHDA